MDAAIQPGRWVRVEQEGRAPAIAFVYLDRTAGLSAKGYFEGKGAANRPNITFRLTNFVGDIKALGEGELAELELPSKPEWLSAYGPQPLAWGSWRDDDKIKGLLQEDYPNDVESLFFDPQGVQPPEKMWVRLHDRDPRTNFYIGELLNKPHGLEHVRQGDEVALRVTMGTAQPVHVNQAVADNSEKYEASCTACGFDILVVAADALISQRLDGLPKGTTMESFIMRCHMCGENQLITRRPTSKN